MSAGQTRMPRLLSDHSRQIQLALEGRTIHQYSEQLSGFWRRDKDLEDGGMAVTDGGGPEEDEEEEQRRQRRRRRRQKVVNCCKKFAAFLFSHIGLATMVVAYSIMGGFLFRELEAPAEREVKIRITEFKDDKIDDIWRLVVEVKANELRSDEMKVNELKADDVKGNFTANVRRILSEFQEEVRKAVKDQGWDGKDATDEESPLQWSFAGALLYAVTVITTIGYGHVAPKTDLGRMLTIVYALIGIPLTFLYLSNIGNFMADCFRLFYKRICCDVLCCQQCNRKRKRERLRLRRRREMAAQLNYILGVQGPLPFPFLPSVDDPCLRGKQNQTYRNPVFSSDHDRTPSTETLGLESPERQYPDPPESPGTDGGPLTSMSFDSRTSREDLNSHDRRFHSSGGDVSSSDILETAIIDDDDDNDMYSAGLARETAILHDESETSIDRSRAGGKRSSVKRSENGACAKETDRLIETRAGNEFQRKNNALQKQPYYHSDSQLHANHNPRKTGRGQETGGGTRGKGRGGLRGGGGGGGGGGGAVGGGLRVSRVQKSGESKEIPRLNSTKLNESRSGPPAKITGRGPADDIENPPVVAKRRAFQSWNRWRHRNKSGPTSAADQPETKRHSVQHSMSFNLPSKQKPQGILERSRTTRKRTDNRWRLNLSPKRAHSAESIQPRSSRNLIEEKRGSEESFVTAPSYTFSTDRSDDEDSDGRTHGDEDSLKAAPFTLSRSEPDLSRPLSSVIGPFRGTEAAGKYSNAFSLRFMDDPFDYEAEEKSDEKVTVPISICLVVIGGYIVAGSALFTIWEGWDYLTGSYFCFITLSTIGFGDIVPGTDMKKWASHEKLVLCALWLAFGLSLLAMCFNLMQEEVKDKCKWIGHKLGILNDDNQA